MARIVFEMSSEVHGPAASCGNATVLHRCVYMTFGEYFSRKQQVPIPFPVHGLPQQFSYDGTHGHSQVQAGLPIFCLQVLGDLGVALHGPPSVQRRHWTKIRLE
ncbi:hypothetical protein C0J52_25915 [Blattella germanica]|nr:hypothetical protein C0J52_25915 [Blattella germanica]